MKWPAHLIIPRPEKPRKEISGDVQWSTACGIKVGRKCWSGYETCPGVSAVAGSITKADVDCARCLRTKAYLHASEMGSAQ